MLLETARIIINIVNIYVTWHGKSIFMRNMFSNKNWINILFLKIWISLIRKIGGNSLINSYLNQHN